MSKELSRRSALNDISVWDTEEVLQLLQKNGLEECCKAVAKRQIDGDELLHLTDGKLALWKNDLTPLLIGKLFAFVQELNRTPEKYLLDKTACVHQQRNDDDRPSDSDSWDTDFEDEVPEENVEATQTEVVRPNILKIEQSLMQNNNIRKPTRPPPPLKKASEQEETYANCESCQDDEEDMYQNFQKAMPPPPRNVSRLHNEMQKELPAANKDKPKRKSSELPAKKPMIGPKPETLLPRKIPVISHNKKFPQKSFLHNPPKINQCVPKEMPKRMTVPPPSEKCKDYTPVEMKKPEKELPKPPATIRSFDLVANLPERTEDSGDEYESFDDNMIEQPQKKEITRVDSKLSLHSGRQGSIESVYKPPSAASHDEEQEEYEIYECMPEDNGYLSPIQWTNDAQAPPPLPAKPLPALPPVPLGQKIKSEKLKERSPDKKSNTLPHSGSSLSLSAERATRPLPPPPERQSYVDKPWFHNVTREQANALIKEQGTYNNPQDGYFLMRPSTTNIGNPLALVLWYKDRVYNVPVRKRSDNRYALGSAKINEQSFSTIEEIVPFYMREELVLHTGGVQMGSTKLTDTPPK